MVEYLTFNSPDITDDVRTMFMTANTVKITARCWYQVLNRYFVNNSTFIIYPLEDKPSRVPQRRYPMVEYQYYAKPQPKRMTRVLLVEVMDPTDLEIHWDVKNSEVYKDLRDLDGAHPERKSFGALSAGSHFVLFEVTGKGDPVFLVGSPEKRAHFINDAAALEAKIHHFQQVAKNGSCKCSDPETPGETAVVEAKAASSTKAAPFHDNKIASSSSGEKMSPAVAAKNAPVGGKLAGHTAGTDRTASDTVSKTTAASAETRQASTVSARSSSPARTAGKGAKDASASK